MARGNGECDGEFCARITQLWVAQANGLTGARNCLSRRIPRSLVPPEHRSDALRLGVGDRGWGTLKHRSPELLQEHCLFVPHHRVAVEFGDGQELERIEPAWGAFTA